MEMTYEEWKMARKGIKRHLSTTGWTVLIYYGIVNLSVMGFMVVDVFAQLLQGASTNDPASIENVLTQAAESAWGYFVAAAVGFVILLIWKKPRFIKEEIFAKGAPMKVGDFFVILCIFLGGQTISQLSSTVLELILNAFGFSILEGMASLQMDLDNLSMFLYAGILAPITEEILFRGLIQRSLLPFGKKFAILLSAFSFGLYHGNLIQTPYAFAVGLVLGYVAAEYNVIWAMVLHMINNLVLGDLLYRLLGSLPMETKNLIVFGVMQAFTVAAIILLIAKRREIAAWMRRERLIGAYVGCYFSCAGTITMLIVMGMTILITTFEMITPL